MYHIFPRLALDISIMKLLPFKKFLLNFIIELLKHDKIFKEIKDNDEQFGCIKEY